MNIHLQAILGFTRYQGFDTLPIPNFPPVVLLGCCLNVHHPPAPAGSVRASRPSRCVPRVRPGRGVAPGVGEWVGVRELDRNGTSHNKVVSQFGIAKVRLSLQFHYGL